LLLTLRADFLGHALDHRPFADALQADVILGPMTRDELRRAIEDRPKTRRRLRVEAWSSASARHSARPAARQAPARPATCRVEIRADHVVGALCAGLRHGPR
jgi:hypothetical protein